MPRLLLLALFAINVYAAPPFKIAVIGLTHGHVAGFFNNALKRDDIQIVGIAEPDRSLFDKYAEQHHLSPDLYYASAAEMLAHTSPQGVVGYTNTFEHLHAVEACAKAHVDIMMEKPLAVSYHDALRMAELAHAAKIHVLVNYETTWYASNALAKTLVDKGDLGDIRKVVVHDGHQGPREINVQPEFFKFLTDPKLNGAGALFDFGCYGADLMTWLMRGEAPKTVTAVTQQIKPDIYPNVDDEATVVLTYPHAVAILEPSWNWPFSIKDMQVYGRTAELSTVLRDHAIISREGQPAAEQEAPKLNAPFDDPLHYFAAVVRGEIDDRNSLSSIETNLIVSEILDAARQSAHSGKTITLPLDGK
jgi:scyllo-inositol 2-dehydrogenase (NADP+)